MWEGNQDFAAEMVKVLFARDRDSDFKMFCPTSVVEKVKISIYFYQYYINGQ